MPSFRKTYALWLFLVFLLNLVPSANALPAFARKYGLRCSACHEAWPMLNYFGQKFKDNGYQLMNDRDAPIWQNPSYWPVTFRMTPHWHRETQNRVAFDLGSVPGSGVSGPAERSTMATGFDLSGLDILTGGTIDKNISFLLVPSSDNTGAFHFESVNARVDNLFGSPWLNLKVGKFELDNFISEKRILTISGNGGLYQIYHFIPAGDTNVFGQIGDNQLGLEWLGHSANDRTRVSAALLSSNDGNPGLPARSSYSGFFAASQAFDLGKLGVDRVGFYVMAGQAPTYTLNDSTGAPVPGLALGNKGFSRFGFQGLLYFGKLDFLLSTQHGSDSPYFGTGTAAGQSLPAGARSPVWNGGFVETHYVWNPQLVLIQRSEWVRMSQQALPSTWGHLGDTDAYTFGFRWYPIMSSRAGFAWHNEYSWVRQRGAAPVTGLDFKASSLMSGFDFDF